MLDHFLPHLILLMLRLGLVALQPWHWPLRQLLVARVVPLRALAIYGLQGMLWQAHHMDLNSV